MHKLTPWLISAFAGLVFMFLLNTSPLSRLGLSVDLPAGWQIAQTQYQCSAPEEASPSIKQCAPVNCSDLSRHKEGIPFSTSRVNRHTYCSVDLNRLALAANLLIGAAGGILFIVVGDKRWSHAPAK